MSTHNIISSQNLESSVDSSDVVTLTPNALTHVKQALIKRGSGIGIRLNVKSTGCSGNAYVVNYVDETLPDDIVFHADPQVIICISPKAFPLVKGTQIDYMRKGLNASFVYNNPNVKGACGCGESFTI